MKAYSEVTLQRFTLRVLCVSVLVATVFLCVAIARAQEAVVEPLAPETTITEGDTEEAPAMADSESTTTPSGFSFAQPELVEEDEPLPEPTEPEQVVEEESLEGDVSVVEASAEVVDAPLSEDTVVQVPVLSTDKDDYHPGETATIFGRFFSPLTTFVLKVFGSDEQNQNYTETEAEVTADEEGGFSFSYLLDSLYRPFYEVVVSTLEGEKVAETWFRDAAVADYDQCSNDDGDGYASGGDQGCRFINGALNGNNSTYQEGDATLQRLVLDGFAPGSSHTVTLQYGTTKQGRHAYDFLTSWDHSESWATLADRCDGLAGCTTAGESTFPIPNDTNGSGQFQGTVGARNFVMRGGTLTGATAPVLSGSYAGDSETSITLSFTVPNSGPMCSTKGQVTSCGVILWFGAHIAKSADWAGFNGTTGAGSIEGSPYHVAITELDGGSIGQRDNQMQASAIPATIIIRKDTVPNAPQDFAFTTTGTGLQNFTLDDDGENTVLSNTKIFTGLNAGNYSVTETAVPGYVVTINCIDATGNTVVNNANRVANIALADGETVECTFTNTLQTGSITIVKNTVGGNGSFDFTSNIAGNFALNTTNNTASQAFSNVVAGTYAVAETVPAGWTQTSATCSDGSPVNAINLAAGENVTCTFTNTKDATLTLVKTVVNDNGGTAVENDFQAKIDGNNVAWNTPTVVSVGAHTASETTLPTYTASAWGGDCAADGSVTLAAGENKTCSITNNDNAPKLTLNKIVVNNNGGTATEADWTLTADGGAAGTLSGAGAAGATDVVSGAGFEAGTYTLSESAGPSGYTASGWTCSNGDNDGTISVALGDDITCSITNDDQPATLIVKKVVVNDNGGTAVAADFDFSINGATSVPFEADGQNDYTVAAGTYTVVEDGAAGYTTSYDNCADVEIPNGGTATCTVTNNDNAPVLHLRKVVINDDGGEAVVGDFTLTANGTGANDLTGTSPVDSTGALLADTFALSETTMPGYAASDWVCVGGTQNGASITLGLGQEATCTITNNDQPGTLKVTKITDPASDTTTEFEITASGDGDIEGDDTRTIVGGQMVSYTVDAGTYDVSEADEAGWVETSNTCDDIVVPNGGEGSCTITNVKLATIIIEKDAISNNAQDFTFNNNFGEPHPTTFLLDDDATVALPKSRSFQVMPGTYAVSEDSVAGWQQESATCSDQSPVGAIVVTAGETVTCTFVNEQYAKIILVKNTVGGNATFDFDGTGAGLPTDIDLTTENGTASVTFSDLDQDNTYSIAETALEGWDLTSATCTGSNTPAAITPDPGETVTCTFENTQRGSITVDKVTVGGDASFSFDATGGTAPLYSDFSLTGADTPNTQVLKPGSYTVAEGALAGWDLTALTCTDADGSVNLGTRTASITLGAGENVTCTFENTKRGSIEVIKQTIPDGDTTSFSFAGDLAGSIVDGGSLLLSVVPGAYDTSETVAAGWTLADIDCSDEDSAGDIETGTTAYEVAPGENVSCTYTNVKNPFITIGSTETNAVGDDHTFTVTVGQTGSAGFVPVADGTEVEVTFSPSATVDSDTCATGTVNGSCTVTINSTTPGVITASAATSVTIGGVTFELETDGTGENSDAAVKTYVDARISIGEDGINSITDPHTFTVLVEENDGTGWSPASGETVNFTLVNITANAFFVGSIDDCVTDANGQCTVTINANTVGTVDVHAAAAVGVGGLSLARETDGAAGNSDDAVKTYVAGKIIVKKETIGGDGDFDFTASYDADGFILSDGEQNDSGDLAFGTYNVAETNETGWDLTSATCDNGDAPSSVTIDAAETITCTFTNTARGKIIVEKVAVGDQTQSFAFTADYDQDGFSLTGGQSNDSGFIAAGEYSVTETVPAGWDQTSAVCSGQSDPTEISLEAGETVTCTFTNTERGHLIVEKTTNPAADPTVFTIAASGSGTITGGGAGTITDALNKDYEVTPGTYSVNETVPAGWRQVSNTCTNVAVAAGETKTCTIVNEKLATLTVVKDAQPNDLMDFAFTAGTLGAFTLDDDAGVADIGLNGDIDRANTKVFTNVTPTSYTITETQPNQYWKLKSVACTALGAPYTNVTLGVNAITVNLTPGVDVTCTFVNEKLTPTRTQGFWQTHTAYTTQKFTSLFGAGMTIGNAVRKTVVTKEQLFGAWYSSIPKLTSGKQRTALDKARMTLLQQLVTAKLNCATFGCSSAVQTMIANADTAYSGSSASAILAAAALVDAYNNSGDTVTVGNAGKATPKDSQNLANKAFWDTP